MTITFHGEGEFKIKCKEGVICTSEKLQINDMVITRPGEYEIAGISVESIDGIFIFYAEDMNLVYLKRNKILNDTELEKVESADILFMPVGKIIEPKIALEITNQIEPKILIPMYYDSMDELKKIGGISPEAVDQLKISKNLLPQEERKMVALNVQK